MQQNMYNIESKADMQKCAIQQLVNIHKMLVKIICTVNIKKVKCYMKSFINNCCSLSLYKSFVLRTMQYLNIKLKLNLLCSSFFGTGVVRRFFCSNAG